MAQDEQTRRLRSHQTKCPAYEDVDARCRCKPSYRGRRRHPVAGKPIWQKTTKNRAEVLTWLADSELAAELEATKPHARAAYETLGDEWLDGIESGVIGRRRGKGKPYSQTTIANYRRSWDHVLKPEFGPMVGEDISEIEWQMWVDQLTERACHARESRTTSQSLPRSTRGRSRQAADS